jgi:hypothetical protein
VSPTVTQPAGEGKGNRVFISTREGESRQLAAMYYIGLLLFTFLVLAAVVSGAALGFKYVNYGGIDPAFLGSLIGAAGTIFAATIAYVAVRKQIDQAEASAAEGARMSAKFAAQQAAAELMGLRNFVAWCDARTAPFNRLDEASDVAYLNALEVFVREGGLISFMGQMPQDFFAKSQEAYQRLAGVINAVAQWKGMNPSQDSQVSRRAEFNASIRNAINAVRDFRGAAQAEIQRRENAATRG